MKVPQWSGDYKALYDLIAKHILASISKHAVVVESSIRFDIEGVEFKAFVEHTTEANYMEIYKPELVSLTPIEMPDEFVTIVEILERPATTSFLRESDLLKKMYNNDIGTDSTRHIHIKKLIDIGYVTKDGNTQFQPTELCDTSVNAYTDVGLAVSVYSHHLFSLRFSSIIS
ncbi:putative DNA topoisomerase [Helianthus debilis subsp. tardiflorus]